MKLKMAELQKDKCTFLSISFLTENWHLITVSVVAGHSAVPAVLIFTVKGTLGGNFLVCWF